MTITTCLLYALLLQELISGWGYNGSFTGDIRTAVCHIKHRYPDAPLLLAAYSLGANIMVSDQWYTCATTT